MADPQIPCKRIVCASSLGGVLGAVVGFWGLIYLDKITGGDTDGWDGLVIGAPCGFIAGSYLSAFTTRSFIKHFDVDLKRSVLGSSLGSLAAVPLMALFEGQARSNTYLWRSLIYVAWVTGAGTGSFLALKWRTKKSPVDGR
jgi:hypothetical protein